MGNHHRCVIHLRVARSCEEINVKTETPEDDETLRARLTPEQYAVARCSATERPFTGKYWDFHGNGVYACVVCETPLFDSENKFESGSGWPSYDRAVSAGVIKEHVDESHGMRRIEVRCAKCDSHLGHLFPDGPRETTGERYCINSASLDFKDRV